MTVTYRIRHTTTFSYGAPVSVCHNTLCLTPRSGPRQQVGQAQLQIAPTPTISSQRRDWFGNTVHMFSLELAHETLSIEVRAEATVEPAPTLDAAATPPWESIVAGVREQTDPNWLDACPYLYDATLVQRHEAATAYGRTAFTRGRPVLEAATALMSQIHRDFAYESGATHVHTDSRQALQLRRGVCQDFAHVAIAALRGLGVPARYVSGYLRTHPPPGQPRLVGADQSHAWFAAYMGPEIGWVELDPTNDVACGVDHIRLAVGRDYADVAPVRGVFLGGAESTQRVEVDVEPLDSAPPPSGNAVPTQTS